MQVVDQVMDGTLVCTPHLVTYPPEIEQALSLLAPELTPLAAGTAIQPRWLALNLLAPDAALFQTLQAQLGIDCLHALTLKAALTNAHIQLGQAGLAAKQVKDAVGVDNTAAHDTGGVAAESHTDGQGLLSTGTALLEGFIQIVRHPRQIAHILQ